METKLITTTNKMLVEKYEFHIATKGQVDAALSVYWSLYAEENSLITTLLKATVPEIVVGGTRSVCMDNLSAPHLAGRAIKVANFKGPSFKLIVRGHLPNGISLTHPVILDVDRSAMNLDLDTLSYARELCLRFYNIAYKRAKKVGLILAEAEFELALDEYGAIYFTGEILNTNKAVYWSSTELDVMALPMPFCSQPALYFIKECKEGRQTYAYEAVKEVEKVVTDRYTSLCQRLIGTNWKI